VESNRVDSNRVDSNRGKAWAIAACLLMAAMLVGSVLLPIPYLARSPGPIFNILGESDGKPVLEIEGAKSFPTTGTLDMTTVAESGGTAGAMTVGAAVAALIERDTSVLPDEDAINGVDISDSREFEVQVFDASQSNALGAAAAFLKRPVESQPVVMDVVPDSPAAGKLLPGDIVQSVAGLKVTDAKQVGKLIGGQPSGTSFEFEVDRPGLQPLQKFTITSRTSPQEPDRAVVGILVDNHYSSDFEAVVNLDNIGGPSAGLMLSLGMVDRLTEADLLAGRHVAGTGTIDGEGAVGGIGGIDKKMIAAQGAGAELFLAPKTNCPEVVASTPSGLAVVPVATVDEAVAAIEAWRGSRDLPTCVTALAQNR